MVQLICISNALTFNKSFPKQKPKIKDLLSECNELQKKIQLFF